MVLIVFWRIVFWGRNVEKEKGENGKINEGIQTWIWRVFVKLGHTTSGWTWAWRARELVGVP